MEEPVVLGLDFGGTKIAAAVATLDGRRLGERTVATEPSRGARPNLELGLEAGERLLAEDAEGHRLAAVGASTFGIPEQHRVGLAPAIPGWEELPLGRALESAFECEIRLVTDVKAAAAAELRDGALAGHDPGIYLNLGTGLAVALVVGGRVVNGANGAAGEIGYNLLRQEDVGRPDRAVLESVVSGIALAAAARTSDDGEVSAAGVFGGAAEDHRLSQLVDDLVQQLAFHLVNLAVTINPSRIVAGGGMVRSWDRLERPLRQALDAAVPFPPELVVGAFPFDAALVGAISLAIDAAAEQLANHSTTRAHSHPASVNSTPVAWRPGRNRS